MTVERVVASRQPAVEAEPEATVGADPEEAVEARPESPTEIHISAAPRRQLSGRPKATRHALRPLERRPYLVAKRVMDLTGGLVLLGASLPIVAVLGLLIKLDSPGPVFYRSQRVGRGGRLISVLKFRSMYIDSDRRLAELRASEWHREEFQARFKIREDPRRTRVGRILRRTSLDEIPQFWNVVRGEMSLVGPRPVVDEELGFYREVAGGLAAYLAVRPGLTGLWQVGGRSDTTYGQRVRLDMRYVEELGFRTDIAILIKTPVVVIRGSGAY
ncbi:MAG TPA: sugar transferase [Candidatus Limnocylindrales bacterium]|nr:sugar transferase [Candidatus Limnocylindrales bacterium]